MAKKLSMNERIELVPNISVGGIKIGDQIDNYLDCDYTYYKKIDDMMDDCYVLKDLPSLTIYVDDHRNINTIICDKECFFKNANLIRLKFDDCIKLLGEKPDDGEVIYLLVDATPGAEKGQNQTVYNFEILGLQVWTWRKKVVTVSCGNFDL